MSDKLTPKQTKFVDEYMVDFNGTQAAIRSGYSKKTAQEQSSRLLSNVIISTEIKKRQEKHSQNLEITKEGLLTNLMEIMNKEKDGTFPSTAIKAIEVIGKWLGMDKPDDAPQTDNNNEIIIKIVTKDKDKDKE